MIYTIGHSNHSREEFLRLLRLHGIELLIDVRTSPFSKRYPWFNRKNIEGWLGEIKYEFHGKTLGGLEDVAVEIRRDSCANLAVVSENKRIALMCAEGDPSKCHRGDVLASILSDLGVEVIHILPDGLTKAAGASVARLRRI